MKEAARQIKRGIEFVVEHEDALKGAVHAGTEVARYLISLWRRP